VIPHLTVADDASLTDLLAAEAAVRPHLPIAAKATEVTLMAGPSPAAASPGARWTAVATFPLA
jgi:hypothetical protein